MRRLLVALAAVSMFSIPISAAPARPLLLQDPTVSRTQIAFAWAGQIWIVGRDGGEARRLVAGTARESNPAFSPDGSMVAYSGDYDGNVDVYVVPSAGGQPQRLTWHPGADVVLGWTPDGKDVVFRSPRNRTNDPQQMFRVPVGGGFPAEVPLSRVQQASYSPDGTHVAIQPNFQWEPAWKGYRGGQTRMIWIADLADSSIVKIPQENNSNDGDPMWVGDKIYFLSDRAGSMALYAYDIPTRKVTVAVPNEGVDFSSASAGGGMIVYSQFGALHLFDPATGRTRPVAVTVAADLPQADPHFEEVGDDILGADISPTGQRAVFEARGEILTVPAKKGDVRNLTNTSGAEERSPSWSPDGKWIAYFSDASGEYALHLRNQTGLGETRVIDLGTPPSFFYDLVWSPDSKKIAYSDKRLNLWYVDLDHPKPVLVDTDLYDSPRREFDAAWSADSRWLTYTKLLPSQLHAVYVDSLADGKATQITDAMTDALYPQFDRSGKYLYFTASTNVGLAAGWLDMTSEAHPQTRAVYAAVLRKDIPSPVPLQSDEEKIEAAPGPEANATAAKDKEEKEKGTPTGDEKVKAKKTPAPVTIDFENISQRIVALPIPARNYGGLYAGKEGEIFLVEDPIVDIGFGPRSAEVSKFDLEKRKVEPLLDGVAAFALSSNGEKMLFEKAKHWYIAGAEKKPGPGDEDMLATDKMKVAVDPQAEWRQMYNEVWRIERDFFYDPHLHGLDLAAAEKAYAPYLAGVASRDDLTYLFTEMTGNISVGHMFIRGGDRPHVDDVKVGLLGADYTIDHDRYRFARIYSGENWNPQLHAPLTAPGVDVRQGEYLLGVNGRDIHATDNVYRLFLNTAGVQTSIRVGPSPDGKGARDVTVVPVDDEFRLRNNAWIEANRREVDRLSGGKVAYVYLPDTAGGGFTNFNRYFFSQVGKEAAVIDERFNHGGQLADYIVDYLRRPPMSRVMSREGEDYTEPVSSIYGPKVLVTNQFSGSGGDALPWYFRKAGIGPLVGTRTWGGLVGIGGYPRLLDGGTITAPRWAIYGLNGHWEVENHGIAPDIEVEQDPKLVREGHDPQLERAVAVVLEDLKKNPPQTFQRPPYPVHPHPLP
ncbi:MAG TPA: PDZ domain-containing protein [Thermoanaerobaculia bacterium]|nr:PDZ domain-containing protein [Thermoanaerobaculia bacterium]